MENTNTLRENGTMNGGVPEDTMHITVDSEMLPGINWHDPHFVG